MYNFKSEDSHVICNALIPMFAASADVARSTWLNEAGAKRRFKAAIGRFCTVVDQQIELAYQTGKSETMADNERLRNKIAELTAALALPRTKE